MPFTTDSIPAQIFLFYLGGIILNSTRMIWLFLFEFRLSKIRAFTTVRSPIEFCLNVNGPVYSGELGNGFFGSEHFEGGTKPHWFEGAFRQFIKPEPKEPRHLPLSVIKTVFQHATKRRRLYLMLMFSTGMQPADIPFLLARRFKLSEGKVKWRRRKNWRIRGRKGRLVESYLWPEVVELAREMISSEGRAFRRMDGEPLYRTTAGRNRSNVVAKSVGKYFKRLNRKFGLKVTAKKFRQTGAQLFHKASGSEELARCWLGREFRREDKPYLRVLQRKLNRASARVRARCIEKEIFKAAVTT